MGTGRKWWEKRGIKKDFLFSGAIPGKNGTMKIEFHKTLNVEIVQILEILLLTLGD